jgi:hypothetical protein
MTTRTITQSAVQILEADCAPGRLTDEAYVSYVDAFGAENTDGSCR